MGILWRTSLARGRSGPFAKRRREQKTFGLFGSKGQCALGEFWNSTNRMNQFLDHFRCIKSFLGGEIMRVRFERKGLRWWAVAGSNRGPPACKEPAGFTPAPYSPLILSPLHQLRGSASAQS